MIIGPELLKLLNKTYEPSSFIETRFRRYDLGFKTDEAGRPVLLFIGEKNDADKITGERFARRLMFAPNGNVLKDHWDNKGKITQQ